VFEERIRAMIPDADAFFAARQRGFGIRANTIKIDCDVLVRRLERRFAVREIPWYVDGLLLDAPPTQTVEHYLGYYHVQGAASMLPPLALDLTPGDTVLDMCAAPGSKTSQMATMLENTGCVVANDRNTKRLRALADTVQKSGATNCVVTGYDARFLHERGMRFEKILLDAPCTASGRIVRGHHRTDAWHHNRVASMSQVQKALMRAAATCLAPGGLLAYATCSVEPEENEEVVTYGVARCGLTIEPLSFPGLTSRPGLASFGDAEYAGTERAVRVWPQDNGTEGFFVCRLRKC
jgi:NOL1/NOP2/sun family putative RNA methylase